MSRRSLGAGASGEWSEPSPGIVAQFKAKFSDAVAQLDNAVTLVPQRQIELLDVMDVAADNPNDAQAWQDQYDRLNAVESTINTAQNAVAQVSSWWDSAKQTFGLSGSMGVLQFAVPWGLIATITAAAAAISAVVLSSGSLIDRLRLKRWSDASVASQAAGGPAIPQPVPVNEPGMFSNALGGVTDTSKWVAIAAGAVALLMVLRK